MTAAPIGFALLATCAAVAVAMMLAVVALVAQSASQSRAMRQRIDTYVRRVGAAGAPAKDRRGEARRKQITTKMKSLQEGKRHAKSRIGSARVPLMRAGINITLGRFWGTCMIVGLVATAAWSLSGLQPLATPVVFFFVTFMLPRTVIKFVAARRQKEFTRYFSTAIDIIVRGLKTGLPVQECFRIIGREIPDPCGAEFRTVIDEVNAGLTLEDALERSYQRMPTQELRFFATVIAVQSQTGGNLAEILGNISGVLRGRAALHEKIKALSSEAKMSSIIVGALPFFVAGMLTVMNYPYVSLLWTTRLGELILALATAMMCAGVFVMNRMGKLDM